METTLTAIEFLQQLPEPIKSKALAAAQAQQLETALMAATNLSAALAITFLWDKTPEGPEYWRKVAVSLSLGTLNVQIS